MIKMNPKAIICPRVQEVILALVLFTMGGTIYVLFRTTSLVMFQWISDLHFTEEVTFARNLVADIELPSWILYNLPDCLWTTAYLLIADSIWKNEELSQRLLFASIIPIVGMGSEWLQYFKFLPGVFDVIDFIAYGLPYVVYLFLAKQIKNNEKN